MNWKAPALDDLVGIRDYIAECGYDPVAAAKVAELLIISADRLLHAPYSGRTGTVSGTRELVITKFTYILLYEPKEGRIEILRVMHIARLWQRLTN